MAQSSITSSGSPITVLSYNVCWGCMAANETSENDITAQPLAKRCKGKKAETCTHVCLNNVVSNINNAGDIDLLGLQEATGWHEIYEKMRKPHLGFVHHNTETGFGSVQFATFYNSRKFKLLAFKVGDLVAGEGRPYHILFLEKLDTHSKFIVINIHSSHHKKYDDDISAALSNRLELCVDCRCADNKQWINTEKLAATDLSEMFREEFHIIFMGDTNDHGKSNLWKGFHPFTHPALVKYKVQATKMPPKTCCLISRYGPYSHYGDYILISKNLEYLVENIIPEYARNDASNPASDHLPVLSVIQEKQIKTGSRRITKSQSQKKLFRKHKRSVATKRIARK